MNNLLPKARTCDIIEQEADKELLIYDLRTNKMFQLNETSKIVYKSCGKMSFDELKRRHKFTDDLIHLALAELTANDLLENNESDHFGNLSRREVVKRVGLACAAVLPVVTGIVAPSSASAASNARRANNSTCTAEARGNSNECQSGNCVPSDDSLRCCAVANGTNFGTNFTFRATDENECKSFAGFGVCCSGDASFNNRTCTCT